MSNRIVKVIFLKELRDILRDRRTLFVMIVLPVLIYPLMIIVFGQITALQISKIQKETSKFVLIGGEWSPELERNLDSLAGAERHAASDWREQLVSGKIEAAVVLSTGFDDSVSAGAPAQAEVFYNSSREVSEAAKRKLEGVLNEYRDRVVARRLAQLSADTSLLRPFSLTSENLATRQQQQGDFLGRLLGYLLIVMTVMGAFYPAVDLTAGEKERGTLETLLVSPASRGEIVYGKFLAVMVIAIITALLNLLSLGGTMLYSIRAFGPQAEQLLAGIAISPLSFLLSLLLIIPIAVLFSALLLAIAVSARNYKEGQSLVTPVYTAMILPAMMSFIPGIQMSPLLAAIPIVNVSLLIKEFMKGSYPVLETAICFGSVSLLAGLSLAWATNQFRQESVLFRHAEDVRWSPFRKKRLPLEPGRELPEPGVALFAFAVVLIALTAFGLESVSWGMTKSLLFSQAIILLVPLLLVRRVRLNASKTYGLRLPSASAWPAAIVTTLGGWLLCFELAVLQNSWFPFPPEFVDKFLKLFAELNALPFLTGLTLVAVLPGVVEELFCRGFLLSSFRKRFGAPVAIIGSALAFGLLHLDPYRFVSTSFLGVLLGLIVVATGSIYPAILSHALNNTISFLLQRNEQWVAGIAWLNEEQPQPVPLSVLLLGIALTGAGILWLRSAGAHKNPRDH